MDSKLSAICQDIVRLDAPPTSGPGNQYTELVDESRETFRVMLSFVNIVKQMMGGDNTKACQMRLYDMGFRGGLLAMNETHIPGLTYLFEAPNLSENVKLRAAAECYYLVYGSYHHHKCIPYQSFQEDSIPQIRATRAGMALMHLLYQNRHCLAALPNISEFKTASEMMEWYHNYHTAAQAMGPLAASEHERNFSLQKPRKGRRVV